MNSAALWARLRGGQPGANGLGGPPDRLQLNRPLGAVRHKGTLYISDSENHRVVAID